MNTTKGLRVPRPMGTTQKGYTYQKDPTEENRQGLEQHLITHYLNSNFTYCNKHYNIEELSLILNIPTNRIMGHTLGYGNNIQGLMDTMANGDTLRAVMALALKSTLEDRGRAIEQYSILRASQGTGYKAFVSSEVNKALKLVMESGAAMGTLIKNLSGGPNINILNQGTFASEGHRDEDLMTVDKAVMLLKEQAVEPLGLSEMKQKRIFLHNNIEDTPEVCALKQEGVDTSKEALTLNKVIDLEDDYDHIDRRANEEGFDLKDDSL